MVIWVSSEFPNLIPQIPEARFSDSFNKGVCSEESSWFFLIEFLSKVIENCPLSFSEVIASSLPLEQFSCSWIISWLSWGVFLKQNCPLGTTKSFRELSLYPLPSSWWMPPPQWKWLE
ncbi:hypothetical protein MSU_0571 [Mycoplasma suis str. Illinois]|uniref:Uncharacterized protein n=1 Tax=Mycoplasma suis (strain Illinois) TaxID=768700 RepID=F0QRI4_MYCSL|nr:hypothetical protein MSU_0571 [Mycoplasma suis str. Illinois]